LVGQLPHLLTHEVVAGLADTSIQVVAVEGVLGTGGALAVDPVVSRLAETAALVPILIEPTGRRNNRGADLPAAVVDLPVRAPSADSVDEVEAEIADTGLPGIGVDLVGSAGDDDAGAVDGGVPWWAAAGVELGEVGLVVGTTLANILDDLQAGLALADAVNQYLVGSAGVDAVAPLGHRVEGVPLGTDATRPVDTVVVSRALAVEGFLVELLVLAALVAVEVGAGGDVGGG
jgi:hypothetical protein